jgi:hypothetical protein
MKNKRTNQNLSLIEKIENAEKRIIELKALIKHWKKKLNRTIDNTGADIPITFSSRLIWK